MAANDLVMQGAKTKAVMVLTYFSQDIPISAPEGLILNCSIAGNLR